MKTALAYSVMRLKHYYKRFFVLFFIPILFSCDPTNEGYQWLLSQTGSSTPTDPFQPTSELIEGHFVYEISNQRGLEDFLFETETFIDVFTIVLNAEDPFAGSLVQIREMSGDQSGRVIFQAVTTETASETTANGFYQINTVTDEVKLSITFEGRTKYFSTSITNITKINSTLYVSTPLTVIEPFVLDEITPSITYSSDIDFETDPIAELIGSYNPQEQGTERAFTFNNDGTRLFITGDGRRVDQYELETPFDVTSGVSYSNILLDLSQQQFNTTPYDLTFSPDGQTLFVLELNWRKLYQYDLSIPFDLSGVNTLVGEYDFTNEGIIFTGVDFDPSGTTMIVSSADKKKVFQYQLAAPWDLTQGVTLQGSVGFENEISTSEDLIFDKTGSKLFILDRRDSEIFQYNLNDPWNVTAGINHNGGVFGLGQYATDILIDPTNSKLFSIGAELYQYGLSGSDFKEALSDDGTVEGEMIISIFGDTFEKAGVTAVLGQDYTLSPIPEGLSPNLSISSDGSYAVLTFTGNAVNNTDNDDITDLIFTFNDAIVASGNAASISNSVNASSNIGIDFIDCIITPDVENLPAITAECQLTELSIPTATSNCVGTIEASTTTELPITTLGTTQVIWEYRNGSGSVVTQIQDITIEDTQSPTITVPSDLTVAADDGSCEATNVSLGNPTTTDNCSVDVVSNDAPESFPVGTTTVTWTVTDAAGNETSATQNITVQDTEAPIIAVPADITVEADPGSCEATNVQLGTAATSDNCADVVVANDAPATFSIGSSTVTWTVTDASGNTASATQNVTVLDTQAPTITVPADLTLAADEGSCEAINVPLGTPTTADNCSADVVSNDAPASFPIGTTIVTWTVTDQAGNEATGTQNIVVEDTQAPTITVPADLTIAADAGSCEATNVPLGTPTTADNCSVDVVSNDAPASFPTGTTIVTWTVTDQAGNEATGTQNIVVEDTQAPTITVPADLTVSTDAGSCEATNVPLGTPSTADNCVGEVVTNDAPTSFPIGTTVVTWTVSDQAGNEATGTQSVVVEDTQAPAITVPADLIIAADAGSCEATNVSLGTPTTADNCSVDVVSNDAPMSFPIGTTIVTWTVTDQAGNEATGTQSVEVEDTQAPTITVPADLTIATDEGSCEATNVSLGTPTTEDNCVGEVVTNDAPASFPIGNTLVTWVVTDAWGNEVTSTQTVTVEDTEVPEISCQDISVTLDEFGFASISATDIILSNSDNCGVSGVSLDITEFTCSDIGPNTVEITVTDFNGNLNTCTATVTVDGTDSDNDGICDNLDNCPDTFNPEQRDEDGDGFGAECDADDTNPFINPNNAAPIAEAGPDLMGVEGEEVFLDGSSSSDPDGDPLTYEWLILASPSGSTASLSSITGSTSSLVPDIEGVYTIQLIVNDGLVDSDPSVLTLMVEPSIQTIGDLKDAIDELVASGSLNSFQGRLFNRILDRADFFADRGRDDIAILNLRIFRLFINLFNRLGVLSSEETDPILEGIDKTIEGLMESTSSGARIAQQSVPDLELSKVPVEQVVFYPNAFTSTLNIEYFALDKSQVTVKMLHVSGLQVYQKSFENLEEFQFNHLKIELDESLSSGLYFVITNDGVTETVKRVVKE